ncbi:MAG: lipase family protein, partial [Bacteroidales bacterium]
MQNKLLLPVVILILVLSCSKDPDPVEHDFLVDFEKKNSLQTSFIINILNGISTEYPGVMQLIEQKEYGVDVYRITYNTHYNGNEITASGLLCLPTAAESFPIISFQNGTNTSHHDAPSNDWFNPMFLLLQSLAGNGYIILIPDYFGFGASEDILHPYYVKTTTNAAIIDMIYAAKEFIDYYSGAASYNEDIFLMGYSQGGWATLAALEEIESNYSSEFHVPAISCGAGAYDLINVAGYILEQDTFPSPLYLPYYVYSHQQYGTLDYSLEMFFQEPYRSRIPELFTGSFSNSYINSQLNDSVALLLVPEFIDNFSDGPEYEALRSDLKTNSVEAWVTGSLIR